MPVLSSSPSSWSSRVALLSCILVVTTSNIFGTVRVAFAQKDNSKKDNNNNGNSNSLSCMDREATSCRECLATTDNSDRDSPACGWVPGYGCLDSCSVIADVACYSVASTTVTSSSSTSASSAGVSTSNFDSNLEAAAASSFVDWAEPVCAIADADEADQALCASKLDCASCVATALSAAAESPNNYCQWFGSELMGGDSTDGIGWCGNACTMIGCGETTCAIAGEGQDGVGDNDNDNDNNNDNESNSGYNLQRTLRFASKGCLGGILWTFWYDQIDGFLQFRDDGLDMDTDVQSQSISLYALTGAIFSPSANAAILAFAKAHLAAVTTAVSILMEQFLWCPLVYGTFEIPVSTLMNGGEPSSIRGEVKNKLNGLLVSNAKVWTLANLVIYNAPLEWRLFIGNVIDIFWQSIVSDVSADCGGPGQEECEVEVEVDGGDAIAALFDPNYDEQQGEELLVLASTGETKQQQRNSSDLVGVGTSLVAEKSRI